MVRLGLVSLVAALAFAGAAAGGAPRGISERDSGKRFTVRVGRELTLRLSHDRRWSEPHASSRAVSMTAVEYFADPGFDEWTLHAERPGIAVVRAHAPGRSFRVTIVVR